jgi:hypothetical protein
MKEPITLHLDQPCPACRGWLVPGYADPPFPRPLCPHDALVCAWCGQGYAIVHVQVIVIPLATESAASGRTEHPRAVLRAVLDATVTIWRTGEDR